MRPSVEFCGKGNVVEFWIKARISSGVVFIGTVKWTKVVSWGEFCWSSASLMVLVGGG